MSTREGKGHAQGHTALEKQSSCLARCASLPRKDARGGHAVVRTPGKSGQPSDPGARADLCATRTGQGRGDETRVVEDGEGRSAPNRPAWSPGPAMSPPLYGDERWCPSEIRGSFTVWDLRTPSPSQSQVHSRTF